MSWHCIAHNALFYLLPSKSDKYLNYHTLKNIFTENNNLIHCGFDEFWMQFNNWSASIILQSFKRLLQSGDFGKHYRPLIHIAFFHGTAWNSPLFFIRHFCLYTIKLHTYSTLLWTTFLYMFFPFLDLRKNNLSQRIYKPHYDYQNFSSLANGVYFIAVTK